MLTLDDVNIRRGVTFVFLGDGKFCLTQKMDHFELTDWLWRKREAVDILAQSQDLQRRRCSSVPAKVAFGLKDCSVVLKCVDQQLNLSMDSAPIPDSSIPQGELVTQTVSSDASQVGDSQARRQRCFCCKICAMEGGGVVYLEWQKALNEHTRSIHLALFTCQIKKCKKVFSSLAALKKHKLTHDRSMQNWYPCDKCLKAFVFASELHNHQAVHSEDHRFRCEVCPYTFKAKGELTRHMLQHSGKILTCEVEGCQYTAWEKRFLQEHMKGKHSPKSFVCPHRKKGCGYRTVY